MTNGQTAKVVVMRCVDKPVPAVASKTCVCADCAQPCWVSDQIAAAGAQFDEVIFTCSVCTPPEAIADAGKAVILRSQRAEIESVVGKWPLADLMHRLGIREVDDDEFIKEDE